MEENKIEEKVNQERELEKDLEEEKVVENLEKMENQLARESQVVVDKKQVTNPKMMVLTVFLILFAGVAAFFAYSYGSLKGQMEAMEKISFDQSEGKADKADKDKQMKDEVVVEESETKTGFELTVVDEQWNQYTNYDFGFSLQIPSQAYSYDGVCEWVDTDGDNSYRPRPGLVPVVTTEYASGVYIDFEYRNELGGESTDGSGRTFFSECNRLENDLAYLQGERRTWNIIVEEVADELELENFIQDRFGEGCQLGAQEPTDQEGLLAIRVEGDGLDLGETACPINYMFYLFYAPDLDRIYTWDQGQAYKFASNLDGSEAYDENMEMSFRVLMD